MNKPFSSNVQNLVALMTGGFHRSHSGLFLPAGGSKPKPRKPGKGRANKGIDKDTRQRRRAAAFKRAYADAQKEFGYYLPGSNQLCSWMDRRTRRSIARTWAKKGDV